MRNIITAAKPWFYKLLLVIGMGAVTVSVSEVWFYPLTTDTSTVGILLFYGVFGYTFILLLERFRVRHFSALFVVAAIFGFLVEGVPVPVLYSGLPFTIVWTSLAWHAVFTIAAGWYWFRIRAAKMHSLALLGIFTLSGIGLGLWNSFMWNAELNESTGVLTYTWIEPQLFAEQFLLGYLLFVGGHWLLSRIPTTIAFNRYEMWLLSGLLLFSYGSIALLPLFPFSLVLPVLLFLCWIPLQKHRAHHSATTTRDTLISKQSLSKWVYGSSLLLPISAIGTYWVSYQYQIELEMNAILIITAGPLSVFWFIRGLWRTYRN